MTRLALAVFSAFAYLSAFLMPMLPAPAMAASSMTASAMTPVVVAQPMQMTASHSHCDDSHGRQTADGQPAKAPVKVAPDLCRTGCAAHAPALPSQALLAPPPWLPGPPPAAMPHQRLTAAHIAPDPRPPRAVSFSL